MFSIKTARLKSPILLAIIYGIVAAASVNSPDDELWPWTPHSNFLIFLSAFPAICGALLRSKNQKMSLALMIFASTLAFFIGHIFSFVFFMFDTSRLCVTHFDTTKQRQIFVVGAGVTLIGCSMAYSVSGLPFAATMFFVFIISLWFPLLWGFDIQNAHQIADAERARNRSERGELLSAMQSASDRAELKFAAEQLRLATNLHDTVSSRLAAIALQSEAAAGKLTEKNRQKVIKQIRSEATQGLDEMRIQIKLLTKNDLTRVGEKTVSNLNELLDRSRSLGQHVEFDGPDLITLSPVASKLFYKIVHESLLNAAKHSQGEKVRVAWEYIDGTVHICVTNALKKKHFDHQDADPESVRMRYGTGSQLGLVSLKKSAKLVRGSVTAGEENGNWVVEAYIPR